MTKTAGIVGAGVLGHVLALTLQKRGWKVHLFDQNPKQWPSCSYISAGMLSPFCERETAEKLISELGQTSLEIWPMILRDLDPPVFFQQNGSLVVAHTKDAEELNRLKRKFVSANTGVLEVVDQNRINELEPELSSRFLKGLYFPFEGQIDTRGFLFSSAQALEGRGAKVFFNTPVVKVSSQEIKTHDRSHRFDWVFDCRGLGARDNLKDLRGVRGELIWIQAKDVYLQRPIRVMHPRYSIYVVPRPKSLFVVGATLIESEDLSPITVRSTLELLSAAHVLHDGFSEGHIVETLVQARPAFPENQPRVYWRTGLTEINGLYRHGYLISPKLAEIVCEKLENNRIPDSFKSLFKEIPS